RAQDINDLLNVTYVIYADGPQLGPLIRTGTILAGDVTRTSQSVLCPTCASAQFSIAPLGLNPGNYWLELHAGNSVFDDNNGFNIDWAAVDDNLSQMARFNVSGGTPSIPVGLSGFNQYAFALNGAPAAVPEPGAASLLASGLLLFFGKRAVREIR